VTVPVSALSLFQIVFFLPLKPVKGLFKKKLKKVDFLGGLASLMATVFILVPLSGGGSIFPWKSAVAIVLFILGVLSVVAFVIIEWKFAALPIIPLRLLRHRSLAILTGASFLAGVYYYANTYFLPIYFQIVLSPPAGPLLSSGLLQALLLPQIGTAMFAGFVVQRYPHQTPN
jgi:hypothetical protein